MSRAVQDDEDKLENYYKAPNLSALKAMRRVHRLIAASGNICTRQRLITTQNFNLLYAYLPTLKPMATKRALVTLENLRNQLIAHPKT